MKKVSNGSIAKVLLSFVIGLLLFVMILAAVSGSIVGNVAQDYVYADTLDKTLNGIKIQVKDDTMPILYESSGGVLRESTYSSSNPFKVDLSADNSSDYWNNLINNFKVQLSYQSTSSVFNMTYKGFANLYPGAGLQNGEGKGITVEDAASDSQAIHDDNITLRSDNGATPMNDGVHYVNAGTSLADYAAKGHDYVFYCETCQEVIPLVTSVTTSGQTTTVNYGLSYHGRCKNCKGATTVELKDSGNKDEDGNTIYNLALKCTTCDCVFGNTFALTCSACGKNLSNGKCTNNKCPAQNKTIKNYYTEAQTTHTTAGNQVHVIEPVSYTMTSGAFPYEQFYPVVKEGDSQSVIEKKENALLNNIGTSDYFKLTVDKIYISGTNWKGQEVSNQLLYSYGTPNATWNYPIAGVYYISKLHFRCEATIPYYTKCDYYQGECYATSILPTAADKPSVLLNRTIPEANRKKADFTGNNAFIIEYNSLASSDFPIVCSAKMEIKANSDIDGRIRNNLVRGGDAVYDNITNWKGRISLYSTSTLSADGNGYFSYSYSDVSPFKFYKGVTGNSVVDGTGLSGIKDYLSIYWYSDDRLSEQVKDPVNGEVMSEIIEAGTYYLGIFPKNTSGLKVFDAEAGNSVDYSRKVLYVTFGLDGYKVSLPSVFDDGSMSSTVDVYRQQFNVSRKPLRITITGDDSTSRGVRLAESSKEYATLYEMVEMTDFENDQALVVDGELAEGVTKLYFTAENIDSVAETYKRGNVYYTHDDEKDTFAQVELSGIAEGNPLPTSRKYYTFDEKTGIYSSCVTMPDSGIKVYYMDEEGMASAAGFFVEVLDDWENIGGLSEDIPVSSDPEMAATAISFRGSYIWADENDEKVLKYDVGSYISVKLTMSFTSSELNQNYSIVLGTYNNENVFTAFSYYSPVEINTETGMYEYIYDFSHPIEGEKFTIYPKPITVEVDQEAMGMKEGVFQYGELYKYSDIDPSVLKLTQYNEMAVSYDDSGDFFYYDINSSDWILRIVNDPDKVKKVTDKNVVYLVSSVYLKLKYYSDEDETTDNVAARNEIIRDKYMSGLSGDDPTLKTYGYISRNSEHSDLFDYYVRYTNELYPNESMSAMNVPENNTVDYSWDYYYLAYYVVVVKEDGTSFVMPCMDGSAAVWDVTEYSTAPFDVYTTTKKQQASQSFLTLSMDTPSSFTVQKLNAYYEIYDLNLDKYYDATTTVYAGVYRKAIAGSGFDYIVGNIVGNYDVRFYERFVYEYDGEDPVGYYHVQTTDYRFLEGKDYYVLVNEPIYTELSSLLYTVDADITGNLYELTNDGFYVLTADKKYKLNKTYYTKLDCYQTDIEAYKELKIEYSPTYRKAIKGVHFNLPNGDYNVIPRYYEYDGESYYLCMDEQVSCKKTYYIKSGFDYTEVDVDKVRFYYTYSEESGLYSRVIPEAENVAFEVDRKDGEGNDIEDTEYFLSLSPHFTVSTSNGDIKCDSILENDMATYFEEVATLEYGENKVGGHEIKINPVTINNEERYFRTLPTYNSTDGKDIKAIKSYEKRGLRYNGSTEAQGEIFPRDLQISFLPDPFKITDAADEGYAPGADYARPYQSMTGVALRVAKYDTTGYNENKETITIWDAFLVDYPQYAMLESTEYYDAEQIEANKQFSDLYLLYYMDSNDYKYILGYYYFGEIVENLFGKTLYEFTVLKTGKDMDQLYESVYFNEYGEDTYAHLDLFDRVNKDEFDNPVEIDMGNYKFIFLDVISGLLDTYFTTEVFNWKNGGPTYLAQNWEFDPDEEDGHVYVDFLDGNAIVDTTGPDLIYWYSDENVNNSRMGKNGQNLSRQVSYGAKCLEEGEYYYLHLDFTYVLGNYIVMFAPAVRNGFDDNRIKFSITKAILTGESIDFTFRDVSEERKIGYDATGHKEDIVMADLYGSQYSYISFENHPEADYYFAYKRWTGVCSSTLSFSGGLKIDSCSDIYESTIDGFSVDPNDTDKKIEVKVKYDDCNPIGMVAGNFGAINNLEKHTVGENQQIEAAFSELKDKFNDLVKNINDLNYANFYETAFNTYKAVVKEEGNKPEKGALIGLNYTFSCLGLEVDTDGIDLQEVIAKLFGFGSKSEFINKVGLLADLYGWYKENYDKNDDDSVSVPAALSGLVSGSSFTIGDFRALDNGCFHFKDEDADCFIFPIVFNKDASTSLLADLIIDNNGHVFVWVNNLDVALWFINYNADHPALYTVSNRMYCKNLIFYDSNNISIKISYCDCNLPSYIHYRTDGKVNNDTHTHSDGKISNLVLDSFRRLAISYETMVGSYNGISLNSNGNYLAFAEKAKKTFKKSNVLSEMSDSEINDYINAVFTENAGAVIGINKNYMIRPGAYTAGYDDGLAALAKLFGYESDDQVDVQTFKNNINTIASNFNGFIANPTLKSQILYYNGGIYVPEKDMLIFPYVLSVKNANEMPEEENIAILLFIDKNGNSAVWISDILKLIETLNTASDETWEFTFSGRCSLFEETVGTFDGEYLDTMTLTSEEFFTYNEYQLRGWMIDSYFGISSEHEGESILSMFNGDGELTYEFEEVVLEKDDERKTLTFAQVVQQKDAGNLTGWLIVEFHFYNASIEDQGQMVLKYFKDENGGYKFDPSCFKFKFIKITLKKGNYNKDGDFIKIESFTYEDANGDLLTISGDNVNNYADILNFKLAGTYMLSITIPASTNYRSVACINPLEDSNGYWEFVISPATIYVYPTVATRKFMATYDPSRDIIYRNSSEDRHIVLVETEEELNSYIGYINYLNGDIYKDESSIPDGVTSTDTIYIYHNPYVSAAGSVYDPTVSYYYCQEGVYLRTLNIGYSSGEEITGDQYYIKSEDKEDWVYDLDQIYVLYYGLYPIDGYIGNPIETFSSSEKYASVVNNVVSNEKFLEKNADGVFIDRAQIYGKDKTYYTMEGEVKVYTLPIAASGAYKQNYDFSYPEENSPCSYYYVWKQQLTILSDYHQELTYSGQSVQPLHRVIDEEDASISDVNLNMYFGAYYYIDDDGQIRLIANTSNGVNVTGTKEGIFVPSPGDLDMINDYCAYYYFVDNKNVKIIIFTDTINGKAVSHYYYDDNDYDNENKKHIIATPITFDPACGKTCINVVDGKEIDIGFIDNSMVGFAELQTIKDVYVEKTTGKRGGYIVKMTAMDTTGNYYDSKQVTVLFDVVPMSVDVNPEVVYQDKMFDRNPYGLPTDDAMDFETVFIRDKVVCEDRSTQELENANVIVEYCDCDAVRSFYRWCSELYERNISGYNGTRVNVKYDDCNPFGMIAGDFGEIASLSKHATKSASNSTIVAFNSLSELFATFMGYFEIPTDGTEYIPTISSDASYAYTQFYNKAIELYNGSLVSFTKNISNDLTRSAVIGVNHPYTMTFGTDVSPELINFQTVIANLFGFSSKTEFMNYAQNLANTYAQHRTNITNSTATNKALENGCFYTSNGSFVFPIAVKNELSSPVLAYVILDTSGLVSVWVNDITAALWATNFNVSYHTDSIINNELYCKNILFVTGPENVHRHEKDAVIDNTTANTFDTIATYFSLFYEDIANWDASILIESVDQEDHFTTFFTEISTLFAMPSLSRYFTSEFILKNGAVISINNQSAIVFNSENKSIPYADYVKILARLFGFTTTEKFLQCLEGVAAAYMNNTAGASAATLANRVIYDGAIFTKSESFVMPYFFTSSLSSVDTFAALIIVDRMGEVSVWLSDVGDAYNAANGSDQSYPGGNRPLIGVYGRCVMMNNSVGAGWGEVSVESYYYFGREGAEIGSMEGTTWWCFEKYESILEAEKLEVGYCDCNSFGTVLRNNGDVSGLSKHTSASMSSATIEYFENLFVLFSAFENDSSASNYQAFFGIAKQLFDTSESSITKNLSYTNSSGGIINISSSGIYSPGSAPAYADMLNALSLLFGYDSVALFTQYAEAIATEYNRMSVSRFTYDGAINTNNGFILPYAFVDSSAIVLAFVFIDRDGHVAAWISDFAAAMNMASRGITTSNVSKIDVYGRCVLFDTQYEAHKYGLYYSVDKKVLPAQQPTEEEFSEDKNNYYQATTDYYRLSSWVRWKEGTYYKLTTTKLTERPDDWNWNFCSYYTYENGDYVALKTYETFNSNKSYYSVTASIVELSGALTLDTWNTKYSDYFEMAKGYTMSNAWSAGAVYYHNERAVLSEDELQELSAQNVDYEIVGYYSNDMSNAGWYIVLLKAVINDGTSFQSSYAQDMRDNIKFTASNNVFFGAQEYEVNDYVKYFVVYLSRSRFTDYSFRVDYPQTTFSKSNQEINDVLMTLVKPYNGQADDISFSLTLFQRADEGVLPVSAEISQSLDMTGKKAYFERKGVFMLDSDIIVGTIIPASTYFEKAVVSGQTVYIETTDRLFKTGKEYYKFVESSIIYTTAADARAMMKNARADVENGVAYYVRFSVNSYSDLAYNNNYASKSFIVAVVINKKTLSAWYDTIPVPEEEIALLKEEEMEERNGVIYYKSAKYYGETNESVAYKFVLMFDRNDLLEQDRDILAGYNESELPIIDWNNIKTESPVGDYFIKAKKNNDTVSLQNYEFKFEVATEFYILRRTPNFEFESGRVYEGQTIKPAARRLDDKTGRDLSTVVDDNVNIKMVCIGKLADSTSYWYTLKNDRVDYVSGERQKYTSIPSKGILVDDIMDSNFFETEDAPAAFISQSTVRNVGVYLFKVSFGESKNYNGMSETYYLFRITKANLTLTFVEENGNNVSSSRGYASKAYDGKEGNYPSFSAMYSGFVGADKDLNETKNVQRIKYYYDGATDPADGIDALGLVNPYYTFINEEDAYKEYKIGGQLFKPVDVRRDTSGKIIAYHIAIKDDPTGLSGIATNYNIGYRYAGENLYPEMRIEPRPVYADFDSTCDKVVKTYDGTTKVSITITKDNYVFTKTRENGSVVKESGPLEGDDISLIIDYNASFFARKNVYDDNFVKSDIVVQVKVGETLGGAQKGNYVLKFKDENNKYVILYGVINQAKANVRFYERQGEKLQEKSSEITTDYNGENQPVYKRISGVTIYDGQGQNIGNESVSYSQRYYSEEIMFESFDAAPIHSAEYVYEIYILNETLEDKNYLEEKIAIRYVIKRSKVDIVFGGNRTQEYGSFNTGVSATAKGVGGYEKSLEVQYFTDYAPKEIYDDNGVLLRYEDDSNGFSGPIEDITHASVGEYYARAVFQGSSDFMPSFAYEPFTIRKREALVSYPTIADSYVYTGTTPSIEFYITYEEEKNTVTQKLYQVLRDGKMVPYNYTENNGVISNVTDSYPVNVGQYQVRPYASLRNFSLANVSWVKFSIVKANVSIAVKSQTILVGDNYVPQYEVTSSLANTPDISSILTGSVELLFYNATSGEYLAERPTEAGTYKVKLREIVSTNYNVDVSNWGQLKINKKVLDLGDIIIESNNGFLAGTSIVTAEIENVQESPLSKTFESYKDKNEELKGYYLSKTYSLTWENLTTDMSSSDSSGDTYKMTLRVPELVRYFRNLQNGGEAENAAPRVAYAEGETFRAAVFYKSGKIEIVDVEILDDERISFTASSSLNEDGSNDYLSAISLLTPEDLSEEKGADLGWLMYLFIGLGVAALALSIVLVLKRKG